MRIKIAVLLGIVAVATGWVRLRSDGSEILGTPSITIASGTGVVSGGTGMVAQPGSITLDVPAGAVVKQVLLYWEGFSTDGSGDASITVAKGGPSTAVTGTLIGGPTPIIPGTVASTYRADITSLGLVQAGSNTLTLAGLSFNLVNNGAGIFVIFDDGTSPAGIADQRRKRLRLPQTCGTVGRNGCAELHLLVLEHGPNGAAQPFLCERLRNGLGWRLPAHLD